jgi:hypothetical protein
MEPDVPWETELLRRRLRCYELGGDARLREARRDLARLANQEPMPFARGLGAEKR